MILLLFACAGGGESAPEDSGTTDSVPTTVPPGECPEDFGYAGEPSRASRRLAGTGTWSIDFDVNLEANGYVDCSYDRVYPALVEQVGHDWQCPDCTWFATGESTVERGFEDCLALISSSEATRIEHMGIGEVEGVPHLFRSGAENVLLGDLGAITGTPEVGSTFTGAWSDDGEFKDGSGTFVLSATVSMTLDEDAETPWEDPYLPREEPYTCGWSACNPGGPSPDLVLATGSVLPNERFVDVCGEEYDLWDAWGTYVVVDASSPDCGPCQSMAKEVGGFIEELAAQGVSVQWITLLNASLGSVNESPSADTLASWAEAFGQHGPLLADEGYAYALFAPYSGKESGMSFPTVVVVSPDMTVLGWDSGFSTEESGGTGFTVIEELILADAATR